MIPEVLARLMETGTPFRISGGAGALADVKDTPAATPAVFAFVSEERSAPSETFGRTLQRTAASIAVVIVTKNLSQQNNAAAVEDIDALKAYCRRKLIGWVPAPDVEPLEHAAGELQQAFGGTVWFEDAYTTAFYQQEIE
jgi:hypothetical protein